ncbi:MAG TPA: ubiquitin-like domain-containing protein [Actinomycetota bacterium]|nr:ubiquitin-like domain-containing protein [Actinomycetota bacterium]
MASRANASPASRHAGLPRPSDWGAAHPEAPQRTSDAQIIDLVSLQYTTVPAPNPVFGGIFRVAVALGLAAGCFFYLKAQKEVVVVDQGSERRIETFAPTVGQALSRAGVALGPSDRVVPGLEAGLVPEHRIEVLRAKDVVVVINGERNTERVTGRTVDEVLRELSVVSRGALIAPAPSTRVDPGDEIVVAQSVGATVVVDGKAQQVRTNVLTAGGLLRQLGVVLGPYDRVEPSILAYPSEGSTIKVVRVKQAIEKLHSKIGFNRQTEQSATLELGIRKVRSAGIEGVRESSYRILYEDGKVKSRSFLGSRVLRAPVAEVTLVGTHRPTLRSASHNQSGKASWYHQPGMMAAHRTLPLGTVVRVTNLSNGKQVTVTIRDRGPYVDGRIIDLSDTAFKQLSPQSSGVLNVKIEW